MLASLWRAGSVLGLDATVSMYLSLYIHTNVSSVLKFMLLILSNAG